MARTPRPAPKKAQPGLYDRQAETRRQKRGTPYDQAQERPQGSLPTASPSAAGHGAAERPMRPVSAGDEQVFPTRHTPSAAGRGAAGRPVRPVSAEDEQVFPTRHTPHAAPPLPGKNRQPTAPAPGRGRRNRKCAAKPAAAPQSSRPAPRRPQQTPMLPEEDAPAPQLRDRGRAARRRARRRRAVLFSVLAVLAVGVWVLFVFVFKISNITVEGTTVYDKSIILNHFGYTVGDNLFTFNRAKAAEDLVSSLPYLETARVTRLLPGSVHIEVTGSEEKYCFVGQGDGVIVSPSLKVLRTGDNTGGLLEIRGAAFSQPTPGQPLPLENEEQAQALRTALQALQTDILHNCTQLDVSDPYAISLRCEGRFLIRLGTTVELEYKLRLAAETIYNRLEPEATGVVDVSGAYTSRSAYYTPQSPDVWDAA